MPGPRLLTLVSAAALLIGSVLLAPGAEAASYTSTGLRCTKVGSPGPNRMVGTPRRDVICGRGGNDVIDGRGGNDVIDGGAGNDTLRGGKGNDRLEAGAGNDALNGGDGNDLLQGGTGNDRAAAGPGNDTAHGNLGNDALYGEAGNDELLGEGGNDVLVGGAGTNWCDATATDRQTACKTDLAPPRVAELRLSHTTVDISNGPVSVTARLRVTDDTGVRQVQLGQVAQLTAGTVRDGWWTTTITIPRYAPAGPRHFDAFLTDRVGRPGAQSFPNALTVVNNRPDRTAPVIQSMTVSPASVDVRTSARSVTATLRITDDLAGVGTAWLCGAHRYADRYAQDGACSDLRLIAGNALDGTWRASYTVPQGAAGGNWNFQVLIEDASYTHPQQTFIGPDQAQWEAAHGVDSESLPLPGGAGRFTVTGSSDSNAPVLGTMTLRPPTVDVRTASKTVHIDVAATDVEGITGVGATVSGGAFPNHVEIGTASDPVLISGTPTNGVWRLSIEVAQGTPPGSYPLQLWVEDRAHWISWYSPESEHATPGRNVLTPTQAPAGTTVNVQ